jgi:hypothetical protein
VLTILDNCLRLSCSTIKLWLQLGGRRSSSLSCEAGHCGSKLDGAICGIQLLLSKFFQIQVVLGLCGLVINQLPATGAGDLFVLVVLPLIEVSFQASFEIVGDLQKSALKVIKEPICHPIQH